MVKMIVMDLDGTLLHNDKTISEYTLSILRKCKNKGIKVVIATARSEKSAERIIELTEPTIMIVNGGALVLKDNGEIIYKKLLSVKTSNAIINDCINNNAIGDLTVETDQGYYVSYKEQAEHVDYLYGRYYDFSRPLYQETYKITVEIFKKEIAMEIGSKYRECNVLSFSGENWHRFAHKEAEKMLAIEKISKAENIEIKEIIAFGDDYNDIEMIKNCGIGIAMENGVEDIKKIAKYVCKSNEEDGVAKWIKENVL